MQSERANSTFHCLGFNFRFPQELPVVTGINPQIQLQHTLLCNDYMIIHLHSPVDLKIKWSWIKDKMISNIFFSQNVVQSVQRNPLFPPLSIIHKSNCHHWGHLDYFHHHWPSSSRSLLRSSWPSSSPFPAAAAVLVELKLMLISGWVDWHLPVGSTLVMEMIAFHFRIVQLLTIMVVRAKITWQFDFLDQTDD